MSSGKANRHDDEAAVEQIAIALPTAPTSRTVWRWSEVGWIVLVVGLLGLVRPGGSDIVNSLESGYALSVQEMVRDGHWGIPTLNGRPRTVKPPLPFWVSAVVCKAVGAESAPIGLLRAVSAVVGMLGAVGLYWVGGRLFDHRAGLWSALVWASSFLVVLEYRYARHDIYLAAASVVAMGGYWKAWRRERWGWLVAGVGSVLAFQCKGPVSWLLTALPAVGFAVVHRPVRWRYVGGVALCMLAGGLSLLPWVVWMLGSVGWSRFGQLWWEAFGRLASSKATFVAPWFYLGLLGFVLPWTAYLVGAAVIPFEKKFAARRQAMLFCWWQWVGAMVLMSIPFEKTERYAVPMVAPAALLMGQLLSYHIDLHRAGRFDRGARPLWYGHVLTLVGVSVGLPLGLEKMLAVEPLVATAVGLVLSVLGLAVAAALLVKGRPDWAAGLSVAFAVLTAGAWVQLHVDSPVAREPLKDKAAAMMAEVDGAPMATWPWRPPNALIYYAGRTAVALGEWDRLAGAHPDWSARRLEAVLNDEQQVEQAIEPLLEQWLAGHGGQVAYLITRPDRLEQVERLAGAMRSKARVVMDLTTDKPGRRGRRREALVLVKIVPGGTAGSQAGGHRQGREG